MLNLADIAKIADTPISLDPFIYKGENGRAGEIRTHDLLHPMQAFYQAELQPDLFVFRSSHWAEAGLRGDWNGQ